MVIGLISLKWFRLVVSSSEPQSQKRRLITGLVFILESVISTLGVVLGRISYALGREVGLANGVVESDGNLTG